MFCKQIVMKNVAKLQESTDNGGLFLVKLNVWAFNFTKTRNSLRVFSCEFYEIIENSYPAYIYLLTVEHKKLWEMYGIF